uniref:transposase n=1 Tax=Mesorhizobium sp. L-2-11 TaxID=2744521 RepID=UPI001FD60241|nr:transposase [Mesorhizobium sp. L-2-11]
MQSGSNQRRREKDSAGCGVIATSLLDAHVGADADTALVEEIAVTPANINDGKAGPDALPDNPGEVFADSAYRGNHFGDAVRAKGGTPRIAANRHVWTGMKPKYWHALRTATNRSTAFVAGSRRFSAYGNEATAFTGCDGEACKGRRSSPPSPTIWNTV